MKNALNKIYCEIHIQLIQVQPLKRKHLLLFTDFSCLNKVKLFKAFFNSKQQWTTQLEPEPNRILDWLEPGQNETAPQHRFRIRIFRFRTLILKNVNCPEYLQTTKSTRLGRCTVGILQLAPTGKEAGSVSDPDWGDFWIRIRNPDPHPSA